MYSIKKWQRIPLFVLLVLLVQAQASPITNITDDDDMTNLESIEEASDLNQNVKILPAIETSSQFPATFKHHDEDQTDEDLDSNEPNDDLSPKADAEELESGEDDNQSVELEEQYRGSALNYNTDTFKDENIEVSAIKTEDEQRSHLVLSAILVVTAIVCIGLYVGLVMWRSHLRQRYGMRELLFTSTDMDDECGQTDIPYRSTTTANGFTPVPQ